MRPSRLARLSAVLLVALSTTVALAQRARPAPVVRVELLAIKDWHGNLDPPSGANGLVVDGGEGLRTFGKRTEGVSVVSDLEADVAYFRAHSPVSPGSQNRIVRVD